LPVTAGARERELTWHHFQIGHDCRGQLASHTRTPCPFSLLPSHQIGPLKRFGSDALPDAGTTGSGFVLNLVSQAHTLSVTLMTHSLALSRGRPCQGINGLERWVGVFSRMRQPGEVPADFPVKLSGELTKLHFTTFLFHDVFVYY